MHGDVEEAGVADAFVEDPSVFVCFCLLVDQYIYLSVARVFPAGCLVPSQTDLGSSDRQGMVFLLAALTLDRQRRYVAALSRYC